MDKIDYNNQINEKIDQIEKELEFEEEKLISKMTSGSQDNSKEAKSLQNKKDNKGKTKIASNLIGRTEDKKIIKMKDDINTLKSMIKNACLDDIFIPNRLAHLEKWSQNFNSPNAFTSNIEEEFIISIMSLKDVEDSWKILLLLGIGVFTEHKSSAYTEIMKN